MRICLCTLSLVFFSGIASAQQTTVEGPQYDAQGHLVGYLNKDGTQDHYVYDTQWRMIQYISKDGKHTIFKYNADGTMQTISDSH